MHKSFHSGLHLDKCAVGEEFCNLAIDFGSDGVAGFDVFPWVVFHLFETEGDTLLFTINIKDKHFEGLSDVNQSTWMTDASPAHVGDVKQSIHALKVNKTTKIGDVLDLSLHLVANLDALEEELALLGAFAFDHLAARKNNVLAVVVDLDNLKFVNLADILVEIFGRDDIDLRAGKKGFDSDVDHKTAFDSTLDLSFDKTTFVVNGNDFFPVLAVGGFLLGEHDHAFVVFELHEKHFNFITYFDFFVFEFRDRDGSFGFIPDVHEDNLGFDGDNGSVDNGSFFECAEL